MIITRHSDKNKCQVNLQMEYNCPVCMCAGDSTYIAASQGQGRACWLLCLTGITPPLLLYGGRIPARVPTTRPFGWQYQRGNTSIPMLRNRCFGI